MGVPARQIGWSTKEVLIWQIAKELEKANKIAGSGGGISTTTTTTTV